MVAAGTSSKATKARGGDMRVLAISVLSTLFLTGCLYRPNAVGGYDEPGVHPQRKLAVYIPPDSISSDGRVAAAQVGLLLLSGVGANLRPGVGSTPAPHVPGRAGVVRGSAPERPRHPNAYLPPAN